MNKLDEISNTPDNLDIGFFIEVDLKYPDERKRKKDFLFGLKVKYVRIKIFLKILKN